ncbi:hypothetical protein LC065_13765 [Halobacillus litoralis]|nr:hypothetical protein [Halobacillus litoralis]WLR46632.1 hypothetical protein LC065_13765 [Halobacillus litoralis]
MNLSVISNQIAVIKLNPKEAKEAIPEWALKHKEFKVTGLPFLQVLFNS